MTTKQERFEGLVRCRFGYEWQRSRGELMCALVYKEGHTAAELAERAWRMNRMQVRSARFGSKRFTRACNFVARQLGLWEER